MKEANGKTELATFAAGCFWGVEELFRSLPGVIETIVGYTGGKIQNPTYEQVCADNTEHAEAVQIKYDPTQIAYEKLLETFWSNHNPSTLNRQGPDVGSQYRSAIFYHSDTQKKLAEKSKIELEKTNKYPQIVTEIVPVKTFYPAEDYHQKYLAKRGLSTCPI